MYVNTILKSKIPFQYTGELDTAFEYRDAAGLHYSLVTQTDKGKNFFGSCYTLVNGTYVKDWEIKDYSGSSVDLVDYKIVDIDKDGVYCCTIL